MTPESDRLSDEERIRTLGRRSKAPAWLRDVVALIADTAASIPPLEDDRSDLPVFIYRH